MPPKGSNKIIKTDARPWLLLLGGIVSIFIIVFVLRAIAGGNIYRNPDWAPENTRIERYRSDGNRIVINLNTRDGFTDDTVIADLIIMALENEREFLSRETNGRMIFAIEIHYPAGDDHRRQVIMYSRSYNQYQGIGRHFLLREQQDGGWVTTFNSLLTGEDDLRKMANGEIEPGFFNH